MLTVERPDIKEALTEADHTLSDTLRHTTAFYFLLKALVLAVCANRAASNASC